MSKVVLDDADIGRAITRQPSVFLFDEPLSNLDAKLRASMRVRITDLRYYGSQSWPFPNSLIRTSNTAPHTTNSSTRCISVRMATVSHPEGSAR
mgnify:CR=1 FL=1